MAKADAFHSTDGFIDRDDGSGRLGAQGRLTRRLSPHSSLQLQT